jgi:AAA+ superfamily predicted ATPase
MADFYDQLLGAPAAAKLPWESFAHLGQEADIAASVLRAALDGTESGINLLLYGPPGTGKTSFAATLAARVGARLRPVAEADEAGEEPCRHERLAGLRLAQRLATPGDTLLLFDEAEDLFISRNTFGEEPATNSRVFMHRLLEQLPIPVIWTANDISVLGPAVLRRMTMCLELKVPNLATRTRLWRQMGEAEGVLLHNADAARLARLVPAAPAVASTALRATRLAGGKAATARLIVEGVARAVHGGALPAPEREHDALYDPALVNADCDLAALLDRLARPGSDRSVSLLLSGPPGSGKSAWVRHMATQMGLQVLQKRASDILDAYVGGTERNIADAFAEARDTNAFLVFDEADSLLLNRMDAARSWEITQVNEMLTWMEEHALPFACTTNLLDRLDRASLRRFLIRSGSTGSPERRLGWPSSASSACRHRRSSTGCLF